jgi:hypothetical protein
LDVKRENRTSSVRFAVDLAKLTTVDLQRLHDLLATRPKGYQLVYEIAWLLTLSLRQQGVAEDQINIRVCELLLSEPINPRRN